jgi:hypothetical protein
MLDGCRGEENALGRLPEVERGLCGPGERVAVEKAEREGSHDVRRSVSMIG